MANTKLNNYSAQNGGTIPIQNSEGGNMKSGGTIIAGHEDDHKSENPEGVNTLVGFLVSYSKTELGEYWVLREGNNFLGKENDCNIKLNEGTVSSKHATLNITRNEDENKFDVVLIDTASANGTFLNGKKILAYNGIIAKNNDKLRIGNYELKLMIVDKYAENLKKSDIFRGIVDYDYSSREFNSDGTKPMNY
ncbi:MULTISPECIES: FHA domain-containing protein [Flectobacillus]|uniref:FHA domain-containing protein n=1 Tax=Flectobacillus TaxID=101 RepID=UPI00041D36AF|nr:MULTISPECIES: FHA domain-containing protein [Flectobacillus]MDI9878288.1 FHA domain-containing protein [Flectobacillus longus]